MLEQSLTNSLIQLAFLADLTEKDKLSPIRSSIDGFLSAIIDGMKDRVYLCMKAQSIE